MKSHSRLLACLFATIFTSTAWPLTVEIEVTPAYVREHADQFSVKALKGEDGLIKFTIKRHVPQPMYHVAHLAIYRQGKLIVSSDTPLIGKKRNNTFHFSIALEDIAESKFSLSDSSFSGTAENAIPLPGTKIHQFRLIDFAPKEILKPSSKK